MTTTLTAYSFYELSKKAKEKAIEEQRYLFTEDEWWDNVYEHWKEKLTAAGYEVKDIFFSGFASQGDGACFTGSVNVLAWLKVKDGEKPTKDTRSLRFWLERLGEAAVCVPILHSGRYYHRYAMDLSVEWNEWPEPPKAICQLEKLEKQILDDARDLALELYRDLEKEYEYFTSDEYITEELIGNPHILFWEDGRSVNEQ